MFRLVLLIVLLAAPARAQFLPFAMWKQPGLGAQGESCRALLAADVTASGVYLVDPDGPGGGAPFEVYCDMTTDGGGWTLVMRARSGDESGWTAATGDLRLTATPSPTGATFKLSDARINQLRGASGVYRWWSDGLYNARRFAKPFTYNHASVDALDARYSYSNPACTLDQVGGWPSSSGGTWGGGFWDTTGAYVYFFVNDTGWSANSWGVGNTSGFCLSGTAGCNFTGWVR